MPTMKCSILLAVVCAVLGEKTTEENKKRGLYDEGYPGSNHGMLINTHYEDEGSGGYLKDDGYRGYQFALLSTLPVHSIPVPRQVPIIPKQYYVVTRKVAIPVPYGQRYPLYDSPPPYQVKLPYDPYQQYYVPKQSQYVAEDEGYEYSRPAIDERSAYQIGSYQQKAVPMAIETGTPIFLHKPYYVRPEKDVYAPGKALAYAIGVSGPQIPIDKQIYVPVIEKTEQ